MKRVTNTEVIYLAEQYRADVPDGFLREVDILAADLVQERVIAPVRSKGGRRHQPSNTQIKSAILGEISLLLCSDDPKYKSLRGQGNGVTKDAVHFIAGVIVATLGLASGAATGCVAFLVLACARVSVGVYCRLNPPELPGLQQPIRSSNPDLRSSTAGSHKVPVKSDKAPNTRSGN
ncbi:MAG: hypothetical protein ABI693_05915 [Bryobacteraceae bacterium]